MLEFTSPYERVVARNRAQRKALQSEEDYRQYSDLDRNYTALLMAIIKRIPCDKALIVTEAKAPKVYTNKPKRTKAEGWQSRYDIEQILQWEQDYKRLGSWTRVGRKHHLQSTVISYEVNKYRKYLKSQEAEAK